MNFLTKKESKGKSLSLFERANKRLQAHEQKPVKEQVRRKEQTRIAFIIDATGSRQHNWIEAQSIQARMFSVLTSPNDMKLRLVHFGGGGLKVYPWMDNPEEIAGVMAEVTCDPGKTKILGALKALTEEDQSQWPETVILVGDAFEEDTNAAKSLANSYKEKEMKIFSFLEGNGSRAHAHFELFANITGGKFARFGEELPLADLCEAVALLTHSGEDALNQISNEKVKQLLLTGTDR